MVEPILLKPEVTKQKELNNIFINNNTQALHSFINKYNNYETVKEILCREMTIETYSQNFIHYIANINMSCYRHSSAQLMKILIDEYGFVPKEKIFNHIQMTFDMFVLFDNYFDMAKYKTGIRHALLDICWYGNLDNLKKFINMGYDVNELNANTYYVNTAYDYLNTVVHEMIKMDQCEMLEYLLSIDFNYKAYEHDILKECIINKNFKMLMIFVKYGADINILKTKIYMPSNDMVNIYDLLVSYDIHPLNIIGLVGKSIYDIMERVGCDKL